LRDLRCRRRIWLACRFLSISGLRKIAGDTSFSAVTDGATATPLALSDAALEEPAPVVPGYGRGRRRARSRASGCWLTGVGRRRRRSASGCGFDGPLTTASVRNRRSCDAGVDAAAGAEGAERRRQAARRSVGPPIAPPAAATIQPVTSKPARSLNLLDS
jgi:hypothetical protein